MQKYILFLLLLNMHLGVHAQVVNISNTNLNTCNATIFDDGGPNGDYSETDYTMTICTDTGTQLYFVVNSLTLGTALNEDSDLFNIYEGTGLNGAILYNSETDTSREILITNSSCITINLQTNPVFFCYKDVLDLYYTNHNYSLM